MATGRLRIHLGVAPGVGTTHALIDEARRRAARGRSVVVGQLDAPAAGLERPLADGPWDARRVLASRPDVVLLDDLAAPLTGADRPRWTAVAELLASGADVIATAHITQVASLADVVTQLTGSAPTASVPDTVFADAAAVELVDMAPEALRRRLAHGRLVAPDAVDAALAARYSPEALAGLRALAFTWLGGLLRTASDVGETRERLLVATSGAASGRLLRRAARLAGRMPGASVLAVEVVPSTSGVHRPVPDDDRARALAAELGIPYRQVVADDVTTGLLDVARAEQATQLLVGSGAGRRHGTVDRLLALAHDVDVVVVPSPPAEDRPGGPRRPGVARSRQAVGAVLAVALPGVATLAGLAGHGWLGVPGTTLAHLLAVVLTALVGGLWPALLSAVVGSQLINWFFIPPYGSLDVAEPHNAVTLAVFVLVGSLVGAVVHRAGAGAAEAARAAATSRTLARLAEATLNRTDALPRMLEQGRASFGMRSASLLRRRNAGGPGWLVVDQVGEDAPATPELADVAVPAGDDLVLAMSGRTLAASDQTVLRAFAAQTQNLLERDELARGAAGAARLEATEKLRDSLLGAVGHDLRRPLASARASVESLRSGIALSDADRADLLADATDSLARLSRIVDDLLDLSRLQTGALRVNSAPVWLDEVIPPALDDLGPAGADVRVSVPDDLPPADADAALVRRIVSNLVANALEHGASPVPPSVRVSATADRIEVRVVDRGRGLGTEDRDRIFRPFQRRGDADERRGLGLGLALSRGLAEAMGGRVDAEDTPGGGATLVLTLPVAPDAPGPTAEVGRRERGEP